MLEYASLLIVHLILFAPIPLGIMVRSVSSLRWSAYALRAPFFCVTLWVCDAFRVMHFLSVVLGGPFDPLEMPYFSGGRQAQIVHTTSIIFT